MKSCKNSATSISWDETERYQQRRNQVVRYFMETLTYKSAILLLLPPFPYLYRLPEPYLSNVEIGTYSLCYGWAPITFYHKKKLNIKAAIAKNSSNFLTSFTIMIKFNR